MMELLDYVQSGVLAVFQGPAAFTVLGVSVSITICMIFSGFICGILVGATPGLSGAFAMAVSLPILISVFGVNSDALLPVLAFLLGIMKGATVGGAVPAILFNTPGTPDALLTTFDGYPMAQKGQSGKALRIAHFSSASGDTFSDIILFTTAPFLAILVEAHLGFTEKAALIILSLSFISAVVGKSVIKGLISACLGLFIASIGHGEDQYPRLTLGIIEISEGISMIAAILGVLVIGEIFISLEQMYSVPSNTSEIAKKRHKASQSLNWNVLKRISPIVGISASIGTFIGALPGIGTTLAATVGYSVAKKLSHHPEKFGTGLPEGIAATEAANSAVSGANLIPVLSLGIPGNIAAVFLILATESIAGFNPGPSVFNFNKSEVNTELVMCFGIFTIMVLGNIINWTVGGIFMRLSGILILIPKVYLLPCILLLTLTSIYVQETNMMSVYTAIVFGFIGYMLKKLEFSLLPFVIAFILSNNLETGIRQAFAASGGDPLFFFKSPISLAFFALAAFVIYVFRSNST